MTTTGRGPSADPDLSREVGMAIVGCGYWGPNLVRSFRSLPRCRVEAVREFAAGAVGVR